MALKVIIKILKSILNLTGSQCKENNTGVTWLKRGVIFIQDAVKKSMTVFYGLSSII